MQRCSSAARRKAFRVCIRPTTFLRSAASTSALFGNRQDTDSFAVRVVVKEIGRESDINNNLHCRSLHSLQLRDATRKSNSSSPSWITIPAVTRVCQHWKQSKRWVIPSITCPPISGLPLPVCSDIDAMPPPIAFTTSQNSHIVKRE